MAVKQTFVRAALAACVIAGAAYWAGTRRVEPSIRTDAAPSVGSAPARTPGAVAAAPASGPFGGMDLNALGSKLAQEKAASGKSNPSAATVFEAVEKKLALPVEQRLQVYAGGVGARFCDRIATKSDVYVVVCEFADEASATRGVAAGSTRTVARREVLRVRNATVAIHRTSESAACDADAKKIKDLVVRL